MVATICDPVRPQQFALYVAGHVDLSHLSTSLQPHVQRRDSGPSNDCVWSVMAVGSSATAAGISGVATKPKRAILTETLQSHELIGVTPSKVRLVKCRDQRVWRIVQSVTGNERGAGRGRRPRHDSCPHFV